MFSKNERKKKGSKESSMESVEYQFKCKRFRGENDNFIITIIISTRPHMFRCCIHCSVILVATRFRVIYPGFRNMHTACWESLRVITVSRIVSASLRLERLLRARFFPYKIVRNLNRGRDEKKRKIDSIDFLESNACTYIDPKFNSDTVRIPIVPTKRRTTVFLPPLGI